MLISAHKLYFQSILMTEESWPRQYIMALTLLGKPGGASHQFEQELSPHILCCCISLP